MVDGTEIDGPLNLSETIRSGQTSEPEWKERGGRFSDWDLFNGKLVKWSARQISGPDRPRIELIVDDYELSEFNLAAVKRHLSYVLGFRDRLNSFYQLYCETAPDIVSQTFGRFRGLRLMRASNLFESLICSICSQNNSVHLWNRSVRLLRAAYGRSFQRADGEVLSLFPSPKRLANVKRRELAKTTSLGYRTTYVIEASRAIASGSLDLEGLQSKCYEEAKEEVTELLGVGPKVADCFLLYGLGKTEAAPVDVWIHRVCKKLFFPRRKISREKVAEFLRDRYGVWAGYAQLYLFHFARTLRIR